MSTSTRLAAPADWGQLWPLLVGMGTTVPERESRRTFDALLADDDWLIVLAELEGTAVGYAAAQDLGLHLRTPVGAGIARLHDMYVGEHQRRLGAGRLLMAAVTEWARKRVAYLQWQAHELRSAPFYERLGYAGNPCPQPDYPEFEIKFGREP